VFLEVRNRYHGGSQDCQQGGKLIVEVRGKEVRTMQWEFVVTLVIAIPIILFPAAFVWYLNIGGIYATVKEMREKRVARKERATEVVPGK